MSAMLPATRPQGADDTPPPRLVKAAVVIMALDQERAQQIIARLDEEEIRRLGSAIATLGRTDLATVESAVADFRADVGRASTIVGNAEAAEKLLRRILPPEKVGAIMDEIEGVRGPKVWEKLSQLPPQTLAAYLRQETPQTIAVIFGRLPAQSAARVLRLLPEELVPDVVVRLARMNSVQPTTMTDIEETLKREFSSQFARTAGRDGSARVAEILTRAEKDLSDLAMSALEEREPEVAARVRRIMFTFDDLQRIDRATFGVLIGECPAEKLPVALAGTSEDIRDLFYSSMSERAGKMMRDEIESMGTPRRKAIEEAQAEIVAVAKRLAQEGRIIMLDEDDEDAGH